MKLLAKKSFLQKTIIAILLVICINFIVPSYSHADFGGTLADPIIDLLASLGDAVINLLQVCMQGDWGEGKFNLEGGFLVKDDDFWDNQTGNYDEFKGGSANETINPDEFNKGWLGLDNHYYLPVVTYSPEQIFSNNVSGLDVNFVNPKFTEDEGGSAARLQTTIASWYVALRNLATVGLLSVLVYVGIRIIISSTASDKAKYKQFLMDWLIALLILFFLHYIMSFTITMVDSITSTLSGDGESTVSIEIEGKGTLKTNLLGAARLKTQLSEFGSRIAYLIMYLAMVIYTVIFTWFYLRRLLMMAFLTLIAPLVALTYPIDKMGDSKAQAFNSWLKEYVFNALIQPFHLIIYTVFVGTAMDFASNNIIYMIAAMGFILPAEKILRGFFGFNQAGNTLGAIVGGAAIGQFVGKGAKSLIGGSSGKKGGSGASGGAGKEADKPVRFDKKHGIGEIEGPASAAAGAALAAGSGDQNNQDNTSTPRVDPREFEDNSSALSASEELEYNTLGRKLDQMDNNPDAINSQEYEDTKNRYEELQNKRDSDKQEEQNSGPIRNGRFTNWRRAHGITMAGAGSLAGRTISGAAKFATRTAFSAGVGTFAAAVAMASGGGLAGGAAAFAAGSSVGGAVGNKVAGAVPTIGRGALRAGKTLGGTLKGIDEGYTYARDTGDIKGGFNFAKANMATSARKNLLEGTALGRELDLANGNTNYSQAGAIYNFKESKENIQYLKDQMAASGWTDAKGKKYAAGSIPSDKDVEDKMNSFDEYIAEGVTDIKQIMSAQKAEEYGVSAKQAAIISSIAKDRGINEDVLLDDKKYNQKHTKLVGDYINKGYSEQDANKQADYIFEVAKVQNGVRSNLSKGGKTKHPQPQVNNNSSNKNNSNSSNNSKNGNSNTYPNSKIIIGNETEFKNAKEFAKNQRNNQRKPNK